MPIFQGEPTRTKFKEITPVGEMGLDNRSEISPKLIAKDALVWLSDHHQKQTGVWESMDGWKKL